MTLDFNDGKFPNKENVSPDINIGKSFVIALVKKFFFITKFSKYLRENHYIFVEIIENDINLVKKEPFFYPVSLQ